MAPITPSPRSGPHVDSGDLAMFLSDIVGQVKNEEPQQLNGEVKTTNGAAGARNGEQQSDNNYKVSPGEVFNCQYQAIKELGSGAYGKVWLCWNIQPDKENSSRFVAMKIWKLCRATFYSSEIQNLDIISRSDCEHVVKYITSFEFSKHSQTYKCVVMEACIEDLATRLRIITRFSVDNTKNFASQLICGLNALHSAGLVHLDIKPANLLISKSDPTGHDLDLCDSSIAALKRAVRKGPSSDNLDEILKIGDFSNTEMICKKHTLPPTHGYASPESIMGDGTARPAVDIYSAGCTIMEMLSGRKMFTWDSKMPLSELERTHIRGMSEFFGKFSDDCELLPKAHYILLISMDEPTYRTQEPRGDYGHDGTGYRFTVFGEVLHEHYQVIRKVGWDSHSTTWLAWSRHPGHPFFVHLKIYKAGLEKECNRNLEVLTFLNHSFRGCFVKPLNHFVIRSRTPSANRVVEHQCLVHEKVGESLHSHLRTKLSLTPDQVKTVAKSLLLQLQQLHSKLILHRDVNLQNLFVRHSDLESCKDALFMIFLRCKKIRCTNDKRSCGKRNAYCQRPYVKLDDLKWKLEDYKTQLLHHAEPEVDTFAVRLAGFETATGAPYVPIESPHYNCPESLLKSTFLFSSADIFSVGCIIFELLTGCELFRKEPRLGVSMEQELIVQMAELFGDIPNIFVVLCPLDKLASVFNVNFLQRFINPREKRGWTIREFFVAKVRCTVEEARSIEQLLTMMMRINPFARSTSFECLIHPWLSSPATESPVTQHASSVIPSQPEVQVSHDVQGTFTLIDDENATERRFSI
ncbi:hypothetical protein QR680_002917 [Steinernema hermaphroditum]|uniref:Protein kinase domain-containing protein n=1 Tax=Steinernema hermaphroditum TaxID=289476 RepID=A0AA39LJ83_9BILA|nr:hypothetical protein QR680_002917 [Steinernema hermaphroditum]